MHRTQSTPSCFHCHRRIETQSRHGSRKCWIKILFNDPTPDMDTPHSQSQRKMEHSGLSKISDQSTNIWKRTLHHYQAYMKQSKDSGTRLSSRNMTYEKGIITYKSFPKTAGRQPLKLTWDFSNQKSCYLDYKGHPEPSRE